MINSFNTQYGFEFGAASIKRIYSDNKTGAVCISLQTAKSDLSMYITKSGKTRIFDQKTGQEFVRKELKK